MFLISGASHGDAWTDVLKQAGLAKEQVRFDALDLQQVGGAEFQGPFYKVVHGEPLRIPFYARLYREVLLEYSKEPFNVNVSSLARVGLGVRRTLNGDPLAAINSMAATKDALVAALIQIHKIGGKPLTAAQQAEVRKKAKGLSKETMSALAFLIAVEAHALEWRQRAFAKLDRAFLQRAFTERIEPPKRADQEDNKGMSPVMRRLIADVDMTVLMAGGSDLILGVQKSREKLTALKPGEVFEWNTPLGWVVLRGDENAQNYPANKHYLLIVDAGGDDTYHSGGGTPDITKPISVVIDLKGNDQYLAVPGLDDPGAREERKSATVTPLFGAGVFGYGVLMDAEGNDTYKSFRQSQGRGDFGVGLLWDLAGNDIYQMWTQGQGSADFGSGLLIDLAGVDKYWAVFAAQGFGGPAASGVLIDAGEDNDIYIGDDSEIDFPSQVDKSHNVSFVQGAALGERADGTDGHGLAGGFGALVDGGGDNIFKAGFFAQGISYWYGVGWISTGKGNDRFDAGKYAQGASTHFGVGILHDSGGDDSYKVAQELGIGHGHDYAVGFFMDDSGKDTYSAPNFSLGCSSAQGMGFFWDKNGDDQYTTEAKQVFGCANYRIDTPSLRVTSRTLGVFLDTGGKNKIQSPTKEISGMKSSERWTTRPEHTPSNVPARMLSRLLGVARIANEPETEDPY